jgi:hypothetical protein
VQVVASIETNIGKIRNIIADNDAEKAVKNEVVLAEKELSEEDDGINFMDSQFNQVQVEYVKETEELKVSFIEINIQGGIG